MKVILIKDIEKLGRLGDEIEVKDGYARNYLIPNKSAIQVTPGALRMLEQKKMVKVRKEQKIKKECEQLAAKIAASSCTISVDAGEEDKLFGAVTSEMIAETLRAEDIEIDRKRIILDEPIKTLGVHNIEIRLHPEVKCQVRVWVVKK
ncbi:MAG: 50S ribosomal protein L9 [Candidatus Omnitrophota bacterium]